MLTNEILEEIYKYREEYAKLFNYEITAMFADWRKKQTESGKQSVTLPPKKHLTKSAKSTL
ncbi:MAG: hypothetical protein HC836_29180 [Richelia sp. RM2_1_2]|nr:hypothetical protein [Richelia sp. SM1_7_0]NJN13591.1 hypothetical protein [Richelia sp. RM1_1_1]NJO30125.1 hypothetical protein [Richelia sp. SL_2_1]NJO62158.1 hypothetical protein [Richelia sp. RM2_1_2]